VDGDARIIIDHMQAFLRRQRDRVTALHRAASLLRVKVLSGNLAASRGKAAIAIGVAVMSE